MGSKTCIGSGTLVRGEDVAVQGSGRVLKSYCRQGQQVKKGQLLFRAGSCGLRSHGHERPAEGGL